MMIYIKKLISCLFIFICSFQLALGETISRIPSSIGHREIDKLGVEMRGLRRLVRGDYACKVKPITKMFTDEDKTEYGHNEEVIDSFNHLRNDFQTEEGGEYYEYLLKILSFEDYDSVFQNKKDDENKIVPQETEDCNKEDNILYDLAWVTSRIQLDDDEEEIKSQFKSKRLFSRISNAIQEARYIQKRLFRVLESSYNVDEQVKSALIIRYIEDIALSMNEIATIVIPYNFFEHSFEDDFLFDVPMDLFPEGSAEYKKLLEGENDYGDINFLEVKDAGGFWTLKFKFERLIKTYLKYPSPRNYVAALRLLTVKTMINQLKEYEFMSGGSSSKKVQIPMSCVENKSNGNWEEFEDSQYAMFEAIRGEDQESGFYSRGYLEKLLAEKGLVRDDFFFQVDEEGFNFGFNHDAPVMLNDAGVQDIYIETLDINPMSDILWPALENQSMGFAAEAINAEESGEKTPYSLRYTFNDITHWKLFKKIKQGAIQEIYSQKQGTSRLSKLRKRNKRKMRIKTEVYVREELPKFNVYKDIELFEDILTRSDESFNYLSASEYVIYPQKLGASKYLARKMSEAKADSVWDVVSDDIIKKLKRTNLRVGMPSLYSEPDSRNWGISKMTDVLRELNRKEGDKPVYDLTSRYSPLKKTVEDACREAKSNYCRNNHFPYEKLLSFMESLKVGGVYTPYRELNKKELESHFRLLSVLWQKLRDEHNLLPFAYVNEYEYINHHIKNSYLELAMARLGYLVAVEDLKNINQGIRDKNISGKDRSSRKQAARKKLSYVRNIEAQIDRLKDAGQELSLNRPARPEFLTTFLKNSDKLALWRKIKEEAKKSGKNLFDANIRGKRTLDIIHDIAPKAVLTLDQFESAVDENLHGDIKESLFNVAKEYLEYEDAKKIGSFKEIMESSDHEERKELFEDIAKDFGINSEAYLRSEIFDVDSRLKKILYIDLLERAAVERMHNVYTNLESFCEADDNDHETLKSVFYQSLSVQDELNKMAGINGVPAELMDRVESMTTEEWGNMGYAIGGFVVGAAAVAAFGVCTLTVVCGIAVVGGGAGGILMQGKAAKSEYDMKLRADVYEEEVRSMAELGHTSLDAYESVERSWAMTIIETASIIPLIGILNRSLYLGAKSISHQTRFVMRNHNTIGFRKSFSEAGKSSKEIADEAEVEFSKIVLGFTNYSDKIKDSFRGINFNQAESVLGSSKLTEKQAFKYSKQLQKIKKDLNTGRLSSKEAKVKIKNMVDEVSEMSKRISNNTSYISNTVVNYTTKEVDRQTAKVLVDYFKYPSNMRSFMNSYLGKFKEGGSIEKALVKYEKAKKGELAWGTNWIQQAWYQNTYNMGLFKHDFLRMHRDLGKLPTKEFEKYLYENIDVFTKIFHKAPLRLKTDIPYLMIQGGPHIGKRIPLINAMGESVVIRKIANARARLTAEVVKKQARESLGLSTAVASETLATVTKGFIATAEAEIKRVSPRQAKKLRRELKAFKKKLIKEIELSVQSDSKLREFFISNNIDINKAQDVLFKPSTIVEEELANQLFAKVKPQAIFDTLEVESITYEVMQKTMNDKTLVGLQKYIAMAKVLLVKDLEKVEIY